MTLHQALPAVTGDTDSLLLHDGNNDKIIHEFIAECKKKIGVDIEHSQMFTKAVLSKETLLLGHS